MPSFNTSYLFSKKKGMSIPVVAVPEKVKDALCIDQVHPNGIFKIEPGTGIGLYDQCYIFEDINYKNQDEGRKTSTLLEVMKIYKAMDSQMKFTIASEQQDMNLFMENIFQPIHGEEYPQLEQGIGAWINQKIDEGTRDIRRVLYLTVTCRAQSFEEAGFFFAALDTSLRTSFAALKSRLYRMSGEERLLVLQNILRLGEGGIQPRNLSMEDDSWKNQILPAYIHAEEDFLQINRKYVSILFAQDYDASLDEEKVVHSLAGTLFPTYITLDIEPVKRRLLKDRLQIAHNNNERAIVLEQDQNVKNQQYARGTSYSLGKKKSEIEGLMNQVDENDEEGLFLGMLVLVYADDLDILAQRMDTLKQIAVSNGYSLEPYYHRQLKALNTVLPIGGRQVNHMRFLLTSSAVAFQPFYSKDLHDPGGIILGLNRITKQLLIGNRKSLKNPHGMICGHTGSGKSFFVKTTEIAQPLLFTDDDIIVIDPNNEQKEFITALGGQYFDFAPQCQIYLNPFEVPRMIWESDSIGRNRFVAKMSEYAGRFCAACMKNMLVTQVHLNLIDRAVRRMYEAYFAQKKYHSQNQPTLTQLWNILKESVETEVAPEQRKRLIDIVDCLEIYVTGVYDMFAHLSNLDINHRLVGFGLDDIPENAKQPIMLTLMELVGLRIEYNQEELVASHLFVDEAQMLCEDEFSAEELLYAVETYRKKGAIVTLAVQNLQHALDHPKLRDMFSNCAYKVFFDQGGVDAAALADIQELSRDEYLALSENVPGHGILVQNDQVYLMDARMDKNNILYPLFDTDFHDKAKQKEEKKHKENKGDLKTRILSLLKISAMEEQALIEMCASTHTEKEVTEMLEQLIMEKEVEKEGTLYKIMKG
ncbi:MAG: hypothetical protein J6B26_03910 [Agathobacter sp.]|nr:hypothetical protein [Agathobacter sp.]